MLQKIAFSDGYADCICGYGYVYIHKHAYEHPLHNVTSLSQRREGDQSEYLNLQFHNMVGVVTVDETKVYHSIRPSAACGCGKAIFEANDADLEVF